MTGDGPRSCGRTAAVFAGGRRSGSAVLVDDRHLITAAHVLLRFDPDTGANAPVEEVEVEFPAVAAGGKACRAAASRLDLGPGSGAVDVAVLDLGEEQPAGLPNPVPVWPAARMPDRVAVFGYPLAEGPLNGVWREFRVAGPTTAGAVQLDWAGDAGTFPGHSGGPVVDLAGNRLTGILVEGSELGRFDRFLPVTLIARVWPPLPRRWLMTGAGQAEASDHFTRRARGQRSVARGGDLFRGRQAALAAIRGWLTTGSPGRPLVVTGQPGAGKSAVLARAALALETEHHGPGLAFHARAATITDLLAALADLTGVNCRDSAGGLIGALRDHVGGPWLVMVDALDEVATTADRRQIAELLMNLAALPGVRVAVATRPLAAGGNDRDRYGPDALLPALGVTSAGSASPVDLDSDLYFGAAGVRDYAAVLLTQLGGDPGSPPGGGWSRYRADSQVRDRVAALVADRAGRNYLVAALAADRLSRDAAVDPGAPGFDPGVIPATVGEALDKYLDGLAPRQRVRVRGLLTALAYARGAGLDDRMWLAFATGLGYHVGVEDLDELRDSTAVDYLLQTTRAADRRPVTRLFHQALTDELLYRRDRPGDESLLVNVLLGEATRTGWATTYLRRHAADHAATAGRLDQLLDDPALPARRRAGPAGTPPRQRPLRNRACRRDRVPASCPRTRRPRPGRAGQPARAIRPPAGTPHPGRPHRRFRPEPALAHPLVARPRRRRSPGPHRPRRRGAGGGGGGAAGRHPGGGQRRQRRHGAGVAAGRRRPGRSSIAATGTRRRYCRPRQRRYHRGVHRHRRTSASAPALLVLTGSPVLAATAT
jgi:hypothetical protein